MKLAEYFGLDNEALQDYLDRKREQEWEEFVDECLVKEEQKKKQEIGEKEDICQF